MQVNLSLSILSPNLNTYPEFQSWRALFYQKAHPVQLLEI